MKFNSKCVNNMCMAVIIVLLALGGVSCKKQSAYSKLLTNEYPQLYEFVFERNADSILTFTNHPKSHIRQQAWRALISTPVQDMDDFITQVQYAGTEEAWTALSANELSDKQLSRLHDVWKSRNSLRDAINRVLGKQGNQETLDLLVNHFDEIIGPDSDYEYSAALAMGRLMINHDIGETAQKSILRYAAVLADEDLYRAYFYGFYRGNLEVNDADLLQAVWDGYEWVESPEIRQYIVRIAFNSNAEWAFEQLPLDDVANMNVQLAVELAQQTAGLPWGDKLEKVYTKLMEHKNPVVNTVALEQMSAHPEKTPAFDASIIEQVVENTDKSSSVRLSALLALDDISEQQVKLTEEIASGSEYLLVPKLKVYQKVLSADEFLSKIQNYAGSENQMEVLFATQALTGWWGELNDAQKTSAQKEKVKSLLFELLSKGDRSISYIVLSFLESSGIVESSDYAKLKESLKSYKLPEDVEVYQAAGSVLSAHFKNQAKPLIDSLANIGNRALNQSLKSQGWDVPETESLPQMFRSPNWERLGELEYEPVWVLETEKGVIKIVMDVLSAPATISGIDSLTQAGAYNQVAFHRVVPNFVIQGGDVESGDGFGGPDYVVPTEASEKEYRRGMVGIASAGTDTEGSQYFIMHDWAPHLNGRYTIIGEVIEGMDVVDQILVGNKVTKAYWQSAK